MSVACLPLCMIIILAVKEFQQRNCPYKRRSIGQYQKFFSSLFLKQKTTTKRNFKATGRTRGCLKEACCTLHTAHYTVTNNTLINYPAHVLFLAAAGCRLRNSRGVDSVDWGTSGGVSPWHGKQWATAPGHHPVSVTAHPPTHRLQRLNAFKLFSRVSLLPSQV